MTWSGSVREQLERQRIAKEEEPVLPSRRESDLTVKSSTSSVREQQERREAAARDNRPRELHPWEKEIAERVRKIRENAPMPAWALNGLAKETSAEIEREAQEREARIRAEREQREAAEKAEADRKARIGQLEFSDRQRAAALEGLTAAEAEQVTTRAVEMGVFDEPDILATLAKEVILNRPEHEEERAINAMVVEGMSEANARLVLENSKYFTRREYEEIARARKEKADEKT